MQVLLYDPLFDWTMNPLKAFYLQQHDEQAELNATPGGDELEAHRKARSVLFLTVGMTHASDKHLVALPLRTGNVLKPLANRKEQGAELEYLRCNCIIFLSKRTALLFLVCVLCFSSDSQSFNKVAERVLLRLQEKLKGVEEGTVLSVGGQVNLLIQQAMDPENLSRLFSGWQAWV